MPRVAADDSGDMAAAGGVFGEHNVARAEAANRAVAGFDLDLAGERDDILPSRHDVIAAPMGRRRRTEHDAMGRLQRGNLVDALGIHSNFDVFEVRFVVGAGVKSDDFHEPVCRRIAWEKQGGEN